MIAHLSGTIALRAEASCVIDVAGVGYLLHASARTLAMLPEPPECITMLTEMQVREDAITLFGFVQAEERDWFRLLTTVQGVGGRVALGLLSILSPRELGSAIATADKAALGRAAGVGPKLAIRLVTELRDRAASLHTGNLHAGSGLAAAGLSTGTAPGVPAVTGAISDALSALTNLGYRRPEAEAALARAISRLAEAPTLDALIRDGLKELAR